MSAVGSVSSTSVSQGEQSENFHTVKDGEDLGSIGKQYGFSKAAMMKANPSIVNPNNLYPGDQVVIPESASQENSQTGPSVSSYLSGKTITYQPESKGTKSQIDSRTSAEEKTHGKISLSEKGVNLGAGSSTKIETVTADTPSGKSTNTVSSSQNMSVNSAGGKGVELTISKQTGVEANVETVGGFGMTFEVSGKATVSEKRVTDDGVTTYQSKADVSVTIASGASLPQAGFEVGHTEGVKAKFEVSMPEAAAKSATLESINPFDPSSMPDGTVVKMDAEHYSSNEFKATFKNLSVQTKVTDESGVSVAIEKTGTDTVRVTAGPTEAIKDYNGVGFEFGKASLVLGRSDTLSGATLKTAHFDLSTREGRLSYDRFLGTGQLPAQTEIGISDVATIEKFDFESTTKLDAKYRFIDVSLEVATNTGNSVTTTYPDGSVSRTVELQYRDNVPLTVTQKWDADGTEILEERQYTYTVNLDTETAKTLNKALAGDSHTMTGPVKSGETTALSFTESQMAALMGQAELAGKENPYLDTSISYPEDKSQKTPADFAVHMISRRNGGDVGFAELIHGIANFSNGHYRGLEKVDASVTQIK